MFFTSRLSLLLFFAYSSSLLQHSNFLKRDDRIRLFSLVHEESPGAVGDSSIQEAVPSIDLDDFILNDSKEPKLQEEQPFNTSPEAEADIGALKVLDDILKATDDIGQKQWSRKPVQLQPTVVSEVVPQREGSLDGDAEKTFVMCTACKCAYLMSRQDLLKRNLRVRCSICEKEWFQSIDRVMSTDNCSIVIDMSEAKVNEIKRILADKNLPRHPRTDKVQLFIGNVPYTYTEKDLTDLFAEYGILSVVLVRDTEGASKGFGFIEVRMSFFSFHIIDKMVVLCPCYVLSKMMVLHSNN